MTDYKHDDWYCKPANEAEAKEIVERAIASGAVNSREWLFNSRFYGVHRGCVTALAFAHATKYTIEEIRQKFPLPGENDVAASKSSYAKQQYPLGTPVEVRMNGIWYQAVVHGQAGDYIIARAGGFWYDEYAAKDVRPLRTEREIWVEDALSLDCGPHQGMLSLKDFVCAMYDALQSGQLKAPSNEPG